MTRRARNLLEDIRQHTYDNTPDDELLNFYGTAVDMGLSVDEAEWADETLTEAWWQARGAI